MSDVEHAVSWLDVGGMLDQCQCSCGWTSDTYFDGREYAFAEYQRHVRQSLTKGENA